MHLSRIVGISSLLLFTAVSALACSSSDDTGSSSSSSGSSGSSGSSNSSGSSGSSGQTSSSSSSTSSSSTSSSSGSSGGGSKELGTDCTAGSECKDGKCVKFTDNSGTPRGFCSRTCTKAEDCPEEGWECNLAPYTACVPKK